MFGCGCSGHKNLAKYVHIDEEESRGNRETRERRERTTEMTENKSLLRGSSEGGGGACPP